MTGHHSLLTRGVCHFAQTKRAEKTTRVTDAINTNQIIHHSTSLHSIIRTGKTEGKEKGKKNKQESHDLNSIASDQNAWQQTHCLWQTECSAKPSEFAPSWQLTTVRSRWQYGGWGGGSFCSDLFMQRSCWNFVSRMQKRRNEKIQKALHCA